MQYKVKILMVGPMQSGKTTLANFLSESGEVGSGDYRPTRGCRIVEFEVPGVTVSGSSATAEVELWDISGDKRYEATWPVMQRASHGVVFVYNPSPSEEQTHHLQSLYSQFVQQNGLKDSQCVVFCHKKPDASNTTSTLSGPFSRISQLDTQLDDDSGRVRQDFASFLSVVLGLVAEASTHTENFILQ